LRNSTLGRKTRQGNKQIQVTILDYFTTSHELAEGSVGGCFQFGLHFLAEGSAEFFEFRPTVQIRKTPHRAGYPTANRPGKPRKVRAQVGPDALHPDSLSLSGGMRIDKGKLFAMTKPRAYQRLEPSAGLWFNEPVHSPEDLLAYLPTLAQAMDNLEILI
jgi:hypothetical protein